MSTKYPSIETLYARNKATNRLDFMTIRSPIWECVSSWLLTEKVDGTNIRVTYDDKTMHVKGRTDNANTPADLMNGIHKLMPYERIKEALADTEYNLRENFKITFYGEGYGAGIKGSDAQFYRRIGKAYRCFDVCITYITEDKYGNPVEENRILSVHDWLQLCMLLKIPMVPTVGTVRELPYGEDAAKEMILQFLPHSLVAWEENNEIATPTEGVVARPSEPLYDKYRERLIWKLTTREFKR